MCHFMVVLERISIHTCLKRHSCTRLDNRFYQLSTIPHLLLFLVKDVITSGSFMPVSPAAYDG